MKVFIDHNVTAPAIARIGGITNPKDLAEGPSTAHSELESVRIAFREVFAGNVTLVTSEYCLETLRRKLVTGGRDFAAISEQQAAQSVAVLRRIAILTGGLVADEQVRASVATARKVAGRNVGDVRGQVDFEDLTVLATLIGAQVDEHDISIVVSNDVGIANCQRGLLSRMIGVFSTNRWTNAYKDAAIAA